MKYCKIIRLNESFNYGSSNLTLGKVYAAFPHDTTKDKYYILDDLGNKWWVGNTIEPDQYGLTWRDMVKFYDHNPEFKLPMIGV